VRHPREINRSVGAFEILAGPCCENRECPSRECWPYPGESLDQMKARLRAKYNWPAMAASTEAQTNGD